MIPQQIRSILKYAFFLGLLYLASTAYSPSRFTTAAYSCLYFLTLICVVEFVADVYRNPPDWVQCLFQLRIIAILLLITVLVTLAFNPFLVLISAETGTMRLLGGAVAPIALIGPIIAIISTYSFLYCLESRIRALLFFLIGLAGTLATQGRAGELALFLCLGFLAIGWAGTSRHSAYVFISGFMASVLLASVAVGTIGAGRIWNAFNRGQDAAGIASASGRTEVWAFVIHYCMAHPQGMGYVAGFRMLFREYYSLNTGHQLSNLGTAHSMYVDTLAAAGWLGLVLYLMIMAKIFLIAWRFAKKETRLNSSADSVPRHGIRCSFLLLIFCSVYGMYDTEFSFPLRAGFYILYIIIAMILGSATQMLLASRVVENARTR
jgi:O-antigen ligase